MPPGGFKTENVQSLASVLGDTIYIHVLTQSEVLFLTLLFENNCIYLLMAGLGLCYRAGFSLVAVSREPCAGLSLHGFFCCGALARGRVGSVAAAPRFQSTGSRVVAQTRLLHSTWNLPGPGIESVSLASARRIFLSLSHQGSPLTLF